jgi:hypothetical protein
MILVGLGKDVGIGDADRDTVLLLFEEDMVVGWGEVESMAV